MYQSATQYVILDARVGPDNAGWQTASVWSAGTLRDKVNEMCESLRNSYRKANKLDETKHVKVFVTELRILDNELPNQYEQPPTSQQSAEPTLESLVASIQRLAEISAEGNIDLSAAIKAIQDKIVALTTAGTMR